MSVQASAARVESGQVEPSESGIPVLDPGSLLELVTCRSCPDGGRRPPVGGQERPVLLESLGKVVQTFLQLGHHLSDRVDARHGHILA